MSYTHADHTFVVCAYKDSAYLEECVLSLKNQTVQTKIILSTSTPSDFINNIANKYHIPVFINNGTKGIGGDWNFALSCAKTDIVTIAHQDDIYEPDYTKAMLEGINNAKNPIIFFCHYAELRNGEKVYNNTLLNIKQKMLIPLKPKFAQKSIFVRRRVLSMGCPICCPAVTYVKKHIGENPFTNDFSSNLDWQQWEKLSKKKGSFVYNPEPLMCHRVHENSTTTEIIENGQRSQEDYKMFLKFWPSFIAKKLVKFYSNSEKSNKV